MTIKKLITETISKYGKILKEYSNNNPYVNFERWFIDQIDFTGYDVNKNEDPLTLAYNQFMDEYSYEIPRKGLKGAINNYLRGLPSWFDGVEYYYDIRNLLYALGFDDAKSMDDGEIDKLYYDTLTNFILKGKPKYTNVEY